MNEYLASDTSERELTTIEMGIYYHLGLIAEFKAQNDAAIDLYDQCLTISSELSYLDGSLDHQNAKRSLARLRRREREENHYDIVLINKGIPERYPAYGLLVLGTHLMNHGKRVKLFTAQASEEDILLAVGRARLAGFSVMTAQIPESLRLSRKIKRMFPHTPIVWGGVHPTLYPELVLQDPAIDFVVRGDGEECLDTLLDSLMGEGSYHGIKGLGYKPFGEQCVNDIAQPFDFEHIGPYRFDLIDMNEWLDFKRGKMYFPYPSIAYLGSKGCPLRCSFCINSIYDTYSKRRVKRTEHILDDVENLVQRAGIRSVYFIDEYFFGNPRWFTGLLESWEKRGLDIVWGATFHVKTILNHPDLLLRAKSLGLQYVGVSPESGSNRILKLLNKGITVQDIITCFEFLVTHHLRPSSSFMTHLPTETNEERAATFALRDKLQALCDGNKVPSYLMGPQPFRPYPGTKLYKEYIKNGYREPDSLEGWERHITPSGHGLIEDNYFWIEKERYEETSAVSYGGKEGI